jgi:hypothetical protein
LIPVDIEGTGGLTAARFLFRVAIPENEKKMWKSL